MAKHFIRKCECGKVLAQCRCPSSNKVVEIVRPCRCEKHTPTPQPKRDDEPAPF